MRVFVTRGEQRKISFGNRGACGLGEGLLSNGSLKKLDLVILFFCICFCVAGAVTIWRQSENEIGDDGSCGLGEGLQSNSSLLILNLVSSPCLCFLIFLCELTDLARWMQCRNRIGDVGCRGLGEGLKSNGSLRILNLVSWGRGFGGIVDCLM
jgi:hypothetical protein